MRNVKMTRESFHVFQATARNALKQSEQVPSVLICAGTGCIAGGAGQPHALIPKKQQRAAGLYEADRAAMIQCSEFNPIVKDLYQHGLAERAHELLHVHYHGA